MSHDGDMWDSNRTFQRVPSNGTRERQREENGQVRHLTYRGHNIKGGHDGVVVIINARMQTLAHNKARPDIVLVSCYYILAISY